MFVCLDFKDDKGVAVTHVPFLVLVGHPAPCVSYPPSGTSCEPCPCPGTGRDTRSLCPHCAYEKQERLQPRRKGWQNCGVHRLSLALASLSGPFFLCWPLWTSNIPALTKASVPILSVQSDLCPLPTPLLPEGKQSEKPLHPMMLKTRNSLYVTVPEAFSLYSGTQKESVS